MRFVMVIRAGVLRNLPKKDVEYKMRILFEMDKKDYVPGGSVFSVTVQTTKFGRV